jgi:Zn-dependent protease
MDERTPLSPPPGGSYPPPPPPPAPAFPVTADIPPDSPYHQSPAPSTNTRRGLLGGLGAALLTAWAYGKYILLFAFKFKFFATFLTIFVSFGAYALFIGPWAAAGIVAMFFFHEMGHVIELRRQGLKTSAVILIPFLGAATFYRQNPQSPVRQAEISIAGPIAGTVAATAAFALYAVTHSPIVLFWAYFGFLINLFNLIPFGIFDGSWILAPASKWFQVVGLAILAGLLIFAPVSPLLIIFVLLGLPMPYRRFTDKALDAYMTSEPATARYAIAGSWLVLVIYLAFAFLQTEGLLRSLVG